MSNSKDQQHHLEGEENKQSHSMGGCPGSRMMDFSKTEEKPGSSEGTRPSQLRQWPIQLHLVGPSAPYFQNADVLLAADCVAFTVGDFHKDYLAGKSLAIACPKLDEDQDVYQEKITALIDDAKINTLTVHGSSLLRRTPRPCPGRCRESETQNPYKKHRRRPSRNDQF